MINYNTVHFVPSIVGCTMPLQYFINLFITNNVLHKYAVLGKKITSRCVVGWRCVGGCVLRASCYASRRRLRATRRCVAPVADATPRTGTLACAYARTHATHSTTRDIHIYIDIYYIINYEPTRTRDLYHHNVTDAHLYSFSHCTATFKIFLHSKINGIL